MYRCYMNIGSFSPEEYGLKLPLRTSQEQLFQPKSTFDVCEMNFTCVCLHDTGRYDIHTGTSLLLFFLVTLYISLLEGRDGGLHNS